MNHSALEFKTLFNQTLPQICQIAYEAGQLISEYYHRNDGVRVEEKADGSPVTEADEAADKLICQRLSALQPAWPMVTEESVAQVSFAERKTWQTYWLVDPLDGTKEFIHGSGEYSVNIALIHKQQPVLGVVYGPEQGGLYFAVQEHSNHHFPQSRVAKIENALLNCLVYKDWLYLTASAPAITVAKSPEKRLAAQEAIRVAVSRRHGGAVENFMDELGTCETVQMGSALKSCLVAEGQVDVYPRFGPTSLWDTAASQCIVEAAGGAMLNAEGKPLSYVQKASLLNPFFIAVSDKSFEWPAFPER